MKSWVALLIVVAMEVVIAVAFFNSIKDGGDGYLGLGALWVVMCGIFAFVDVGWIVYLIVNWIRQAHFYL